jgi:ankyrin repeat protein
MEIKLMKCIQVKIKPKLFFTKNEMIFSALMEACMDGHVQVARLLLDHGADVNMPPDSYESPLTLSACGGHFELASLLIERGANLEEVNDEGYTPLMEGMDVVKDCAVQVFA